MNKTIKTKLDRTQITLEILAKQVEIFVKDTFTDFVKKQVVRLVNKYNEPTGLRSKLAMLSLTIQTKYAMSPLYVMQYTVADFTQYVKAYKA